MGVEQPEERGKRAELTIIEGCAALALSSPAQHATHILKDLSYFFCFFFPTSGYFLSGFEKLLTTLCTAFSFCETENDCSYNTAAVISTLSSGVFEIKTALSFDLPAGQRDDQSAENYAGRKTRDGLTRL